MTNVSRGSEHYQCESSNAQLWLSCILIPVSNHSGTAYSINEFNSESTDDLNSGPRMIYLRNIDGIVRGHSSLMHSTTGNALGPYSIAVLFTLGAFLSCFVFNTYFMKRPLIGEPVNFANFFKATGSRPPFRALWWHGLGNRDGVQLRRRKLTLVSPSLMQSDNRHQWWLPCGAFLCGRNSALPAAERKRGTYLTLDVSFLPGSHHNGGSGVYCIFRLISSLVEFFSRLWWRHLPKEFDCQNSCGENGNGIVRFN